MVFVIGVTGSLGSGKTTVAAMFSELGAKVLNADKIAHQQLCPGTSCFRQIIKLFGKDILTSGKIDRKKISEIVFKDLRKLRKLEQIIHPAVRKVLVSKIREYKKGKKRVIVVIDVPLLFEAKFNAHVDMSIVVKAAMYKQIKRAIKQLGITQAEAKRRIKAQMSLRKKIRLADIIIDNNETLTKTKKQVKQIWEKL